MIIAEFEEVEEIWPAIYEDLRALAKHRLLREYRDPLLQPDVLVHETYLRLNGTADCEWQSRAHFFGAASEAMKRVLIDHARERNRLKRQGKVVGYIDFEWVVQGQLRDRDDLRKLEEALEQLKECDPTKASLVQLKFFVGLTTQEAAETLQISVRTAERYWAQARAWLYSRLRNSD